MSLIFCCWCCSCPGCHRGLHFHACVWGPSQQPRFRILKTFCRSFFISAQAFSRRHSNKYFNKWLCAISGTRFCFLKQKIMIFETKEYVSMHDAAAAATHTARRIIQSHIQSICVWNKFISIFPVRVFDSAPEWQWCGGDERTSCTMRTDARCNNKKKIWAKKKYLFDSKWQSEASERNWLLFSCHLRRKIPVRLRHGHETEKEMFVQPNHQRAIDRGTPFEGRVRRKIAYSIFKTAKGRTSCTAFGSWLRTRTQTITHEHWAHWTW